MKKGMFFKEYFWQGLVTICGFAVIVITLMIGGFLVYKGAGTFTVFDHTIGEFLTSSVWKPADNANGGGAVGALIFIVGSASTCGIALLIATPFSLGAAIFISEIKPEFGDRFYRPIVQIFAGIPSVIYGWVGLTVLVPFIRDLFHLQVGHSILAAGLVLSLMIFPTITSVAADALKAVPDSYRSGAYGLGATRWQMISKVIVPAARSGIFTGIILGVARAFGEALAVAMVIGQRGALPSSIFSQTKSITTEITAQMGNAMEGGELKTALWTLALLLFLVSLICIFLIHVCSAEKKEKDEKTTKKDEKTAKKPEAKGNISLANVSAGKGGIRK